MIGLIAVPVLSNFPFSLMSVLLSHNTHDAFRHFNQPVLVLFIKSSSITALLCIIDPR